MLILTSFISMAAKAAPIKIHLWHQMMYSQREVLRELVEKYEQQNPNIKVLITYRETEELRSAYQSAAMGGSGPEIIYGPSDQVGPLATMGIIRPLEDIFTRDELKTLDPLAVISYQKHTYMLGDSIGNNLMLIYNKKLISEPPKNTDELIKEGQRLTLDLDKDGKIDQYGLVFNFAEPYFFVPWVKGFGQSFIDENGIPHLDTPAMQSAFQFMIDLRAKYKIIPKECDYEIANALFKENKAAMIINGDWSWGDYKKANIDFGIARIPMVSSTQNWPAPLVGTKGYSINVNIKDEKTLKATTELLRYLLSAESQLEYTKKIGTLPSHLKARESEVVRNNALMKDSADIMSVGQAMPINPELRAVWDALRTQYQSVLAGTISASEAAVLAQKNTEKQIEVMNEVLQPNWQAYLIKLLFLCFIIFVIYLIVKTFIAFFKGFQSPQRLAYYFMIPSILGILFVVVYPFIYNIAISVSNFSLRSFQDWQIVGFHHYIDVLSDKNFYVLFFKTIIWTISNVFFHVTLGVLFAVLIDQVLPAKHLWRTLMIIPWAIPQYITALTWRGLFNQEYGPINIFLKDFLHLSPVQWLSQPFTAFSACVVTNVWLGFPFMMIVALGGLQSIPKELYEAAKLDGANHWQRFWNITYPLLLPVLTPATILGCIWTFNNLNVIWLVSNSGEPADQTHILVSYVYKSAFNLYRYGYSAALSVIIFIVLLVFGIRTLYKKEEAL